MKQKIYIISPENVKDNTPMDSNVDDSLIKPFIINAEEVNLQTALGTNFYNSLIGEIIAGTVSAVNLSLIQDFIQPMLIQWTFYYTLPHIYVKSTNLGLQKMNNTNSDSADLSEYNSLRSSVRDLAEFYLTRLINELELNKTEYPVYVCDEDQNVKPNKNGYFSGIYINKNK